MTDYSGEVDNIRKHIEAIETMLDDIKRTLLLIESVKVRRLKQE